ncbi:transposase [Streptomyces sp. NPDC059680]|uniref:transposase n=1 Tax=Streptomyces sp. NPDC059680 TaxID=3346904 RepID=UPI0036893D14
MWLTVVVVVADAGYGVSTPFRLALEERGLAYVLALTGKEVAHPPTQPPCTRPRRLSRRRRSGCGMVSQALSVVQGREPGMEVAPIQRDVAQGFDDCVRQICLCPRVPRTGARGRRGGVLGRSVRQ